MIPQEGAQWSLSNMPSSRTCLITCENVEIGQENVKGNVGRQYTTTKKMADVKIRLNYTFSTLYTNMVAVCLKKADNILAELLDHIMVIDVIEEYEETIDNTVDESDNDSLGGQ